jgi:acylphosphatase
MEDNVRAHAIISGRVQGVFYRMEAKHAADRLGVTGWVRNRRDRTVEALFEGRREQVEALIAWCREGPPHAAVHDVTVTWLDYTGEFKRFDIAY